MKNKQTKNQARDLLEHAIKTAGFPSVLMKISITNYRHLQKKIWKTYTLWMNLVV